MPHEQSKWGFHRSYKQATAKGSVWRQKSRPSSMTMFVPSFWSVARSRPSPSLGGQKSRLSPAVKLKLAAVELCYRGKVVGLQGPVKEAPLNKQTSIQSRRAANYFLRHIRRPAHNGTKNCKGQRYKAEAKRRAKRGYLTSGGQSVDSRTLQCLPDSLTPYRFSRIHMSVDSLHLL